MVFLKIFFLIFCSISCAKLNYLFEQGRGQLQLQQQAIKNEDIIADQKIDPKIKQKIQSIGLYKDFFYKYFDKKPGKIYSKTTFLKTEAVTYLVIASPYNKVEAIEECFIFMGCFPYLGFFQLDSANDYAKKLEEKDNYTYVRPVYAYSTLGYLTDNILSSFFYYEEFELAELIFHELFHTIFFVKNEVDFNENLANLFGKKLAVEYFKYDQKKVNEINEIELSQKKVNQLIVDLVKEYQDLLVKNPPDNKANSEIILKSFLDNRFKPQIQRKCNELKLKKCLYQKMDWNHASFAAFLTYEDNINEIEKFIEDKKFSLKDFYDYLIKKEASYQRIREKKKPPFVSHILNEEGSKESK